jgi:hypothetical protein
MTRPRCHGGPSGVAVRLLLVVLAAALVVAAPALGAYAPALAQDDLVLAQAGERIRLFEVEIDVADDGSLVVSEHITYDFGGNQRRGIFRVIPVRRSLPAAVRFPLPEGGEPSDYVRALDLDGITVSSNTAPDDLAIERPGPNAGPGATVSIRIGDEDVHITGEHRYTIAYRVRGAMNGFGDDPPELNWNATGDGWSVPIDEARVTVRGGEVTRTACFRGVFGSTDTCEEAEAGADVARFAVRSLAPGEGVTVVVGYAPGSVAVPDPVLHHRWTLPRALAGSWLVWPLTVLTTLVGIGGVLLLAFRQGRDRVAIGDATADGHVRSTAPSRRRRLLEPRAVPVRYRPPEDLRPALLGLVVDESVDPVDISATVVDLAVRGHLRIEEESDRILWFSRDDWRLVRQEAADDPVGELRPYETMLLDGLFTDDDGAARDEVQVSELKGSFATEYQKVQRAIYEEGRLRRWFNGRPDQVRSRWVAAGIGALVAAIGLTAAALVFTTVALAALPLVVGALLLLASAPRMPHRTPKGSALLTETLGFKEFVHTAETDRMDFAEAEQLFVTYLPYAVVFGVVDRWAERFAAIGVASAATVGAWYVGSRGGFDARSFSSGLSQFSSNVGSSLATVPSSGGGSGFSGGSSGGGGGGGGGGSW